MSLLRLDKQKLTLTLSGPKSNIQLPEAPLMVRLNGWMCSSQECVSVLGESRDERKLRLRDALELCGKIIEVSNRPGVQSASEFIL